MRIGFKLDLVLGRLGLWLSGRLGKRLYTRLEMLFVIIECLAFCFERSSLVQRERGIGRYGV